MFISAIIGLLALLFLDIYANLQGVDFVALGQPFLGNIVCAKFSTAHAGWWIDGSDIENAHQLAALSIAACQ